MTAPLLPTAAMAWLLSNRPTTATSAELNSCCRMVLAASGNANRTILSHRDPCSMSIWLFFWLFPARSAMIPIFPSEN